MLNVKEIADEADVIVNGYAFKRCEEGVQKDFLIINRMVA